MAKSRSHRALLHGAGSIMDIGGTNYKKTGLLVVKKGSLASDQRAIAGDFRKAMRKVVTEPRKGK